VCCYSSSARSDHHFRHFGTLLYLGKLPNGLHFCCSALTCLPLPSNSGDAIDMANFHTASNTGNAGNFLQQSLNARLPVKMDSSILDNMAGCRQCYESCAHSRVAQGDSGYVLPWF
jgi:hypothetical protein